MHSIVPSNNLDLFQLFSIHQIDSLTILCYPIDYFQRLLFPIQPNHHRWTFGKLDLIHANSDRCQHRDFLSTTQRQRWKSAQPERIDITSFWEIFKIKITLNSYNFCMPSCLVSLSEMSLNIAETASWLCTVFFFNGVVCVRPPLFWPSFWMFCNKKIFLV